MRGLTMAHRVRIYRVGKDGSAISQTQVYDTRTKEEAIALGIHQLKSAPRETYPLVFEIYDPTDRLVMSYTSETQSMVAST